MHNQTPPAQTGLVDSIFGDDNTMRRGLNNTLPLPSRIITGPESNLMHINSSINTPTSLSNT
jgi:hypothetical protein